jgi:glycerophosphoryl diester phosphodiesterase
MELLRGEGPAIRVGHRGAPLVAAENSLRPNAPALDDALDLVRSLGIGVQLDVKMLDCAAPVAEALRRHGLRERALASSFELSTLRTLAAADPELRRSFTYPNDRRGLSGRRLVQPFVAPALAALRRALPALLPRRLRAAGAAAATLNWNVVSSAVVERCHGLGVAVWVWTVDDAAAAEALDGLGADAIITNDPGIFARSRGIPTT